MGSAPEQPQSFLQLTPRDIGARIADTNDYSGGGTAAALTAASATAVTKLVLTLSERRKSNAHVASQIQRANERVARLEDAFYTAADSDSAIFRRMMETRRQARQSGNWHEYHQALQDATLSPIQLAEQIITLLNIIEAQLPFASRFTASDLGAAAALAQGALQATLLTAEINIELLRGADFDSTIIASEIDNRRTTLEEDAERLTKSIIQQTKKSLHPDADTGQTNQGTR